MTLEELVQRARAAAARGVPVKRAQLGLISVHGAWEARGDGCCGIGLAMIGLPSAPITSFHDPFVTTALGVTDEQLSAFMAGFDGAARLNANESWYQAGRALAAELLPKAASEAEA